MKEAFLRGAPVAPRFGTLHEALAAAGAGPLGLTFADLREQDDPLPFASLRQRARRTAFALRALGVERGDRVAIVLPTCPAFVDAFFGTLFAGAIPVPLYPPVRLGRLDEYYARTAGLIDAVGARLLLTDAPVWTLLGEVAARARPALGVARISGLSLGPELEEPASAADVALIQFSSGTTVDPKPVALTHANVLANVAAIDSYFPEDGPVAHSGVSWLPLYHDMGLIGCLLLAIAHPGALTLLPPEAFLARPALWLRALSRTGATVSVAPNFAFGLCLKRVRDEELDGVDLSRWRVALTGAEPISPSLLREFARRFSRWGFDQRALLPVYGLSEAALAVTFARPGLRVASHEGRELPSVGMPVPGVDVRIAGAGGSTLAEGQTGEVLVRGPSVMQGYFGNAEATARALRDGWLRTGDLGFVRDGELYLCGREKDLIILRGRNHAPQEFEDALHGLEGVRAGCVAAVGRLREGGSEELVLLVETEGAPAAGFEAAIRARVVERTQVLPDQVYLLERGTLPRTSSGKLRRGEALRLLQAGLLTAPRRVSRASMALAAARSMLGHLRARLP